MKSLKSIVLSLFVATLFFYSCNNKNNNSGNDELSDLKISEDYLKNR